MFRLYIASLGLIVVATVMLGGLWFSMDRVLARGEYLWTYLGMAFGVAVVVLAGVLGGFFQRFERRMHAAPRPRTSWRAQ